VYGDERSRWALTSKGRVVKDRAVMLECRFGCVAAADIRLLRC
jgi:hypothetical protein